MAHSKIMPIAVSTLMNAEQLLQLIDAAPWCDFAQPEWNEPETVARILRRIVVAPDEFCRDGRAYNEALYAFGNNHAGTYYPVLLPAMPLLQSLVRSGTSMQQRIALCLLDDLYASFHPERGFEIAVMDGETVQVESVFRACVRALRPTLEHVAAGDGPNAGLGHELLMLMTAEPNAP
jgi:hypothetical protein